MPSRLNSSHLDVGLKADATVRRLLSSYRIGLLAAGILWVLVASTLCGCRGVNGWVMNQSGRQYYKQGNYVAAKYEFERAMMDAPYKASYAYNAARATEKQGDTSGAADLYSHALTINPSHKPSYSALTTMLNNEGRTDDARNLIAAWQHSQPYSAAANVEAAQLERMNGNLGGAEQQLQVALNKRPAYVPARREMRSLLRETGRPYEAGNLMLYRQLSNNPYNQSMAAAVDPATGAQPSAAQHIVSYMPHVDPNMPTGIIQASFNRPDMNQGGMGMPMESSSMMAPEITNEIPQGWTPVQNGQTPPMMAPGPMLPNSTEPTPAPMHGTHMQGMPVPGQPMMMPQAMQMQPMSQPGMPMQMMPGQMHQPQMMSPQVMSGPVMSPHGVPPQGMPMPQQGMPMQSTMMPPQGIPMQSQGVPMQMPGQMPRGQMVPPQMMQGQMMPPQHMPVQSTMMPPQGMPSHGMPGQPMMVPSPYPVVPGQAPQMMPMSSQPHTMVPTPAAPVVGATVPAVQAF